MQTSLFLPLLLTAAFSMPLKAQTLLRQTFAAAGGSQSPAGLCISWTFGQAFVDTAVGNNLSVRQGFQQPETTAACHSVSTLDAEHWTILLFPNPTNDVFYIQMPSDYDGQFMAQLFDGYGQLVLEKKMNNGDSSISLGHLPQAFYFLQILEQKTGGRHHFKIFKSND